MSPATAEEIPAPTVYACSRYDGAFGYAGNFLVPQAALDEWVRLVVAVAPEYSIGKFVYTNQWYCDALMRPEDQGGVTAIFPKCRVAPIALNTAMSL